MSWLTTAVIVLALGLDNLLMSVALGVSAVQRKRTICLVFALFEGLGPAAGMTIGASAGQWLGGTGFLLGLAGMAGLGVYMIVADDDDSEVLRKPLRGWGILAAAIGVSLDELAAGVSFGLLSFPLWQSVIVLFVQALAFSYIGLTFGAKLKPLLGETAEKIGGVALVAAAAYFAMERWIF